MAMRVLRRPLLWVLVAATLFVLWAAALAARVSLSDDALITLTFAKNLARGSGFVFNHPPPVLGTTTPLFTLLVALLAWAVPGLRVVPAAVGLAALCWAGLGWAFYAFRRDLGLSDWQVAAVAGVLAVGPWVRYPGMEASLFALLLVLATGLCWRGRPLASGLVTGLLFLTRGEGALLLPILLVPALARDLGRGGEGGEARRRSSALALTVGFAAPVLMWAAWAAVTFGGFLPSTLAAKIAQGSTGLWRGFADGLLHEWLPAWGNGLRLGGLAAVNLWYAGVVIGLAVVVWRRRRLLPLPLWGAAYVAGYTLLGVPSYPWYGVPVHFVLSLLFAVGLGELAELLQRHLRPPAVAVGLASAVLAVAVFRLGPPTVRFALHPPVSERHLAYRRLAGWLADNAGSGASVAYHEIGYLGFYSDCRIVDLMGLVTPEVAEHVAVGDFAWAVWRFRPDYLVYLEGSGFESAIVTDPRFRRSYGEVARLEGYDGRTLTVYGRRGDLSPAVPGARAGRGAGQGPVG